MVHCTSRRRRNLPDARHSGVLFQSSSADQLLPLAIDMAKYADRRYTVFSRLAVVELRRLRFSDLWHITIYPAHSDRVFMSEPSLTIKDAIAIVRLRVPGGTNIRWMSILAYPSDPLTLEKDVLQTPDKNRNQVYFIGGFLSQHVKIGVALRPEMRCNQLNRGQAPEALEVKGIVPGGYPLEAWLHKRFSHLRVHGEWFRMTDEIAEYIYHECL